MPASKTPRAAPEPPEPEEPPVPPVDPPAAEPEAEAEAEPPPPTKPAETAEAAEAARTRAGGPEVQPLAQPPEPPPTQPPPEPVLAFDRWADRATVGRYGPEAVGGFGAAMRQGGQYFGTAAEWEARMQGWLEEPSSMLYPEGVVPPAG